MTFTFDDISRAFILGLSMTAAAYLAIVGHNDVAVGALIGAAGMGASFFFPGKTPPPSDK